LNHLTVPVAISLLPYKRMRGLVFGEQLLSTASAAIPVTAADRDSRDSWAKREFCTRFATAKSSLAGKIRLPLEKSVAIIKH